MSGDPDAPYGRQQILNGINRLLDDAEENGGQLDKQRFWRLMETIVYGRGIFETYHAVGLAAVDQTPKAPASTYDERCVRAYNIAVTARLLHDVGGTCLVPGNYSPEPVVMDLLSMMDGPGGEGSGTPLILYSKRLGEGQVRAWARLELVCIIEWRRGASEKNLDDIWCDLIGPDKGIRTYKDWRKKCGGPNGDLCREAREAGKRGDRSGSFSEASQHPDRIAKLIKIANSGQGPKSKDPG